MTESSIHSTLVSVETLTPASPLLHSETQASSPSPFSQAIFQTFLGSFPSFPRKKISLCNKSLQMLLLYTWHHPKSILCLEDYPKSIEWPEKEHTLNCFHYNFVYSVFPNILFLCFQHYFFVSFNFDFWPNMPFVFIDVDFHLMYYNFKYFNISIL